MKTMINNSAKRVLSLVLAIVMLVGTLFVANVGINIKADAAETNAAEDFGNVVYLESTTPTEPKLVDGVYVIDTVEKLAWVCTKVSAQNSAGKTFKVADGIDTFVLQTKSYIDSIGGLSALAAMSADEIKTTFETKTNGVYNWNATIGCFSGNFDGNGVAIYGMYAATTGTQAGLFPMVDGGECGTSSSAYIIATYGSTFKNFAVRNSYITGKRWIGAIIGSTNWQQGGAFNYGWMEITACEVSNCALVGKRHSATETYGGMGIVTGSVGNDPATVDRLLVYGNKSWFIDDDGSVIENAFSNVTSQNKSKEGTVGEQSNTVNGYIKNSILVGAAINDVVEANRINNKTLWDVETIRGSAAMTWVDMAWGTDWYAVENELPTPIKPDSYIDPDGFVKGNYYAGGAGTKDDPYIIRTTDQLNLMVTEQSYDGTYVDSTENVYIVDKYVDGVAQYKLGTASITSYYSKYYKVADGVDAFYINDVETQAEANAVFTAGSYLKWTPASFFAGNFDGNGATIYGLMSTSNGFVKKLDGTHAAIKNVNFKAAHIESGSYAAVVTIDFGVYGYSYRETADGSTIYHNRDKDGNGNPINNMLISNVSVTESFIKSKLGSSSNNATAGGIAVLTTTPNSLTFRNCLYDGNTSTLVDAVGTTGGANPNSTKAGIVSMSADTATNRWYFYNCVSINEYPVSMKSGLKYGRFTANSAGGSTDVKTLYGTVNPDIDVDTYPRFAEVRSLEFKSKYDQKDVPILDWANTWELVELNDNVTIPMPTGLTSDEEKGSYVNILADTKHPITQQYRDDNYYGMYQEYTGSGTEADPYLIKNDIDLARAIACGGKNLHQKLYYKLVCDIELTTLWLDQISINKYNYVPFEGTLDGAGFVVSGLSATDLNAAGLIPVLNGGTVKNLHIRNSYAGSHGVAGLIAGNFISGNIDNCSVEGSVIGADNTLTIVGSKGDDATAKITNSYCVVDGNQTFFNAADTSKLYPAADAVWYKGTDGIYRHIDFAKAHKAIDVDADGVVDGKYTTGDIVVLRNHLLERDGYANIYGDVSRNGTVNISDLAILRRSIVGDFGVSDGFWRNLELGTTKIYYAENDTQDMARKLQLYLEAKLENKEVAKIAGANVTDSSISTKKNYANEQNAIVITKTLGVVADDAATATYDDYSVTYDSANNVLTISGGSFTAVEQAVLELINTDNIKNKANFADGSVLSGSILDLKANKGSYNIGSYNFTTQNNADSYKSYRWVDKDSDGVKDDGELYYYAWGDEFESTEKTTFDSSEWGLKEYRTEDDVTDTNADNFGTTIETGSYLNLESANVEHTKDLWVVENGRLTINRGINTNVSGASSLLGKGYVETPLELNATNDFGSYVDENDKYVDPGDIVTINTMLFKYGYAEMRASLPSDGHAFPAWWILTGPASNTSKGIEASLYDKIYKLNSGDNVKKAGTAYDGVSDTMNGSKLSTYKYQIPAAHLEFDIVELMQASASSATASDYRDYFQATVHRIYSANVYRNETGADLTDDILYIPNWTNGTYSTWSTYTTSGKLAEYKDDFKQVEGETTYAFRSNNSKPYLNNYDPDGLNSKYPYKAKSGLTTNTVNGSFSMSVLAGNTTSSSSLAQQHHKNLQKTYTYGFTWDVVNDNYKLAIYCDIDEDGIMEAGTEKIFEINNSTGLDEGTFGVAQKSTYGYYSNYQMNDPVINKSDVTGQTEASIWNQYGYILLDNAFYTSYKDSNSKSVQYTSLGVDTAQNDKVTFDIEYVRVYQEDGKRDIVTPETENFNNGNHFGY